MAPGSFRGTYQEFEERIHPDDREGIRQAVDATLRQRLPYSHEYRVIWPDGSTHWILGHGQAFYDATGKPVRMLGVIIDITRRKEAECALRESEHRFRLLAEHARDVIYRYRFLPQRGFEYVSPSSTTIIGYTPEEHYKDPDLGRKLIHPDDRHQLEAYFQGSGRFYQPLILRWRHKDGHDVWTEQLNVPVYDEAGNLVAIEGVVRDVTERKRAEEALRQAEARYRSIFENAVEGIFQTTPDGQFLAVNPALVRLYGYDSAEEVISTLTDIKEQLYVNPECRTEFQQRMQETGRVLGFEFQIYRKDGSIAWVSENARAVRGPDGAILCYEGTVEDITARKEAEQALQRAEAQLRHSQKMEAIGQLAGGVAHDFNNLLTVINGYAESLLEEGLPTGTQQEFLREILKAGQRAAALTRQLLAFSRRQMLQLQMINLNSLVSEIVKMIRRLIGEDIALHVQLDPALGAIKADPGQIEQLVLNLIVNSRDAMPLGGELRLETSNLILDDNSVREHPDVLPGCYVRLSVSDTGCGMDATVKAHLFEPFFTTKGVGKGTGLGLATVYGIVKQSSGHVEVESEPGQGTTFHLYFPQAVEGAGAFSGTAVPERPARGTETILFVEDDDSVRALAAACLRASGYKVLEARTGREALELVNRAASPIHLLLTDVVLPQMNGRELAELLLSVRPELKVLYVSGSTDDAIGRRGLLQTGSHFLHKPFTPATLTRKVREVLDQAASSRPRAAVQ